MFVRSCVCLFVNFFIVFSLSFESFDWTISLEPLATSAEWAWGGSLWRMGPTFFVIWKLTVYLLSTSLFKVPSHRMLCRAAPHGDARSDVNGPWLTIAPCYQWLTYLVLTYLLVPFWSCSNYMCLFYAHVCVFYHLILRLNFHSCMVL